jgi:hypothetical protein
MKRLLFLLTILSGTLMVSCSKDQAWVKRIEGDWNLNHAIRRQTESTSNVIKDTVTPYQRSYTFNKCKLDKVEVCPGSWTDTVSTVPFDYAITEDGYKLILTSYEPTDTNTITYHIVGLEDDAMTLVYQYSDSIRIDLDFTKK